ncbi:MAG: DNA methyltransferase, partial [Methanosarcinales archaeon]
TKETEQENLNYALVAETHTPMYLMHKYWARKPHNVVAEYIKTYSKEGEIILDPFCGSGVTAIEALHLGRKAVAIDLNPVATFITRMTAIPINLEEFKKTFNQIEKNVKNKIYELYASKCNYCNNEVIITHVIWSDVVKCTCGLDVILAESEKKGKYYYCKCGAKVDQNNNNKKREEPIEVFYECEKCKNKFYSRKVTKEDLDKIRTIENNFNSIILENNLWYPKVKFTYANSNFLQLRHGLIKDPVIENLFPKRNLIALSMIFKEIQNLPENSKLEKDIKDLMKFTFTSAIGQASKMVWVIKKRGGKEQKRKEVGGWTHHFYWNPTEYFEVNAWNCFEERYKKVLRGKKDSNAWYIGETYWVISEKEWNGEKERFFKKNYEVDVDENIMKKFRSYEYKYASDFDALKNKNKTILIKDHSALELVNEKYPNRSLIPPDSVDYVFTDPPYGDSIQYFELSYLWNAWLGFEMESREEIIKNARQGKNDNYYSLMLNKAFKQIYRVLKPGKYLTVTFHNTDIKIRNILIRSVVYAGFDLDKIIYQPPARASPKALLHPYGTPIGDYYIRFKKPLYVKTPTKQDLDKNIQERIIIDAVTKILAERGEPTSYAWIMNTIDTELSKRGYSLVSDPKDIKKTLEKHLDREFVIVDVAEGLKELKSKKWWFKDPQLIPFLEKIPLNERIERAVVDVLRREVIVTFDDILQEIYIKFPNALTPETQSVKSVRTICI